MNFTRVEEALWLLGFIGHGTLTAVLLTRSGWRKFPVFTGLMVYQLAESILLFLVSRRGTIHAYFLAYWIGAVVDYVLQVGLTIELAAALCRREGTWIRSARRDVFTWTVVGFLSAAVLSLMVAPPSTTGLNLWDLRATLFTSLLTCFLVLRVSVTSNRLRLQRGNHVMALGQGLALWAGVAVLGDVLKLATGWRHDFPIFDQIRMIVYISDLAFWSFAFWGRGTNPVPLCEQVDCMAILRSHCGPLPKLPAASE